MAGDRRRAGQKETGGLLLVLVFVFHAIAVSTDGPQDFLPAIEAYQAQQAAEVMGCLDGTSLQPQVKFTCHRSQTIEGLFQMAAASAPAFLECLKLMRGLADPLTSGVRTLAASDFAALVDDPH